MSETTKVEQVAVESWLYIMVFLPGSDNGCDENDKKGKKKVEKSESPVTKFMEFCIA